MEKDSEANNSGIVPASGEAEENNSPAETVSENPPDNSGEGGVAESASSADNAYAAENSESESPTDSERESGILPDELFNIENLPSNSQNDGAAEAEAVTKIIGDNPEDFAGDGAPKLPNTDVQADSHKLRKYLRKRQSSRNASLWKPVLHVLTVFGGLLIVIAAINLLEAVLPAGTSRIGESESPVYALKNSSFSRYTDNVEVTYSIEGGKSVSCSTRPVSIRAFIKSVTGDSSRYISNYSFDTALTNGMDIEINLVTTQNETLTETLTYSTVTHESQTIPKGTTVKVQSGINGLVTREYEYTYVNGEKDTSTVLSETVIKPSQDEIIYVGVGGSFVTPNGATYDYSYYIDVEATAYGVDTGFGGDSSYVASGKPVSIGMIAVDPNMIPLGSKCYVTGDYKDIGVCYAEDTGGAIIGNRIDVYLGDDLAEQIAFGRRKMRVYILE